MTRPADSGPTSQVAQQRFHRTHNLRPRRGAAVMAEAEAGHGAGLPECLARARSKAGVVWAGAEALRGWSLLGDGGPGGKGRVRRGWPAGVGCLVLRGEMDFVDARCGRACGEGGGGRPDPGLCGRDRTPHTPRPPRRSTFARL